MGGRNKINITRFRRIGVTGAPRIGKTTLTRRLAILSKLEYIPDISIVFDKIVRKEKWRGETTSNKEIYENFSHAVFYTYKWVYSLIDDAFISDNTFWDVFAYCILKGINIDGLTKYCYGFAKEFYDAILFLRVPGYSDRVSIEQERIDMILEKILPKTRTYSIMRGDIIIIGDRKVEV